MSNFPLTNLIGYVLYIGEVGLWEDLLAFTSFIFILIGATHKINP
jgi:hypothetical protein